MDTDYPFFLIDTQEFIAEKLQERLAGKLTVDEIEILSCDVVEMIRAKHGGEPVYVPKAASWECKKRHDEMWQKFNGANHHELCQQFGRSLSQVYRIVQRCRQKNKSQLDWCTEK